MKTQIQHSYCNPMAASHSPALLLAPGQLTNKNLQLAEILVLLLVPGWLCITHGAFLLRHHHDRDE